jgi:D-3-phosphoglycerate dehydrogenase
VARILVSESSGFSAAAAERLRAGHELELADLDRAGLLAAVADADVLWVRLRHRIDEEVFAAAERLRFVVSPTTGLDHIDLDAPSRHAQVLSLQGETEFLRDVRATAEHTLALMLALLRRLPAAARHVAEGGWDRDRFRGHELRGRTVGIVGYGRLGRIVAGYLRAFDAEVIATDPGPGSGDVELVALDELLRRADVVSLHAPLTDDTRALIGRDQIAAMRPGAMLVNTARGALVDEAALLAALEDGRLAGAALDVLSGEDAAGMGDHPLVAYARGHDNLIVTPHVGGATHESMEKTELFMAERLAAVLEDE